MPKIAVSLTLSPDNLLWVKGRAAAGRRNLSAAIDALISDARTGRLGASGPVRSVVGTIDLAADDPALERADLAVRDQFATSLSRSAARDPRPTARTRARVRVARSRG